MLGREGVGVQFTLTEGLILGMLALAGTLYGSWVTARASARQVQTERDKAQLAARVERERIEASAKEQFETRLMARITQLQEHLQENEADMDELRVQVATLREENGALRLENNALRARVRDLETELERICGEKRERSR